MFVIDGAIAVFNGFLVQTFKFWCECVRGGVCCNGECHCDEGECCNDEWKTEPGYCCGDELWSPENDPDAPCEEGWTFLRWGEDLACCGCVPPVVMNPELNGGIEGAENVAAALCCPSCGVYLFRDEWGECPGRCCENGSCENKKPSECGGVMPGGCCEDAIGCPVPCCAEDGYSCEEVARASCIAPSVVDETSATCEQACKGACCGYDPENGYVPLEISPATRSDCENAGGEFQGVGTTECLGCIKDGVDQGTRCRLPFDGCCCEEKTSTGYGLTFYQPRDKRMPPFSDTVQVTVEFTTLSPILIHGDLFEASAYNNCNKALTFLLCWDAFNVEPFPCGTRFAGLDIKVCWDQYATDVETLKFSGCNDITVWLGNCQYECETFMTYEGGGHTSNASVVLHGDGTIYANGTGPLVLTSNITHAGNCDRTLTLAGTNDQLNEVRRILDPGGSPVCHVVKDGPGRWRLNATSRSFNGDLTVKNGTLQIAHGGAVGSTVKIGGGGSATFLLEENVTTNVSFDVLAASGRILIGGVNDSGLATYSSGEIRMGHPVTLAATTGGSVDFSNSWAGPSSGSTCTQDVIIGAVGFAGTALLNYSGTLHTTGEVFIANGDVVLGLDTVLSADGGITLRDNTSLRITGADGIDPSSQVTAEDSTLTIEAEDGDPAATQSLDDLVVTGSLTIDGTGSLTIEESLTGDGSITIDGVTMTLNTKSMMTGEMSIAVGTLIVNELVDNPGGLVESATFTSSTLTVTFTGDPQTGDEYVLLSGPTANSYGTVTMTGTSMTGTYDSSTSTLTID